MPSTGFDQGFSEIGIGPRGIKIIDHRPMPDPGGQGLLSKAARSASDPPPAPLEDTFSLHSRPGATKVIYLDFDGHSYVGGSYAAWNFKGSDSTFSDTELTIMQLSWRSLIVPLTGPNPLPISPLLDMMSLTGPKKGLWNSYPPSRPFPHSQSHKPQPEQQGGGGLGDG
jgi:hypothetical protein